MPRVRRDYVSSRSRNYPSGIAGRAGALSGRIAAERDIRRALGEGRYGDARDNILRARENRVIRFAQRNTSLGSVAG